MNKNSTERPLVSLVIPVYNSMPYLLETLGSLREQGLEPAELEVILVDDGSDDGSETELDRYAEEHPNARVLRQENSGGPAAPCNRGVAAANGRYLFVLGSDDLLTDGALGDLARYAEAESSQIVLAKMAGLGGRHAPGSMFTRSTARADLVGDRLFNSLSALKLFRTDLVRRCGAFFPTHLRIGEDQPFTAACYLAADRISIRADRDYVLIRKRDDGTNLTAEPRTATEYTDLLTASVRVIVAGTEAGQLRDHVLRRTIRGALAKALDPRFLDLDDSDQEAVVAEIRKELSPYFTETVAGHLDTVPRLAAKLACEGRTDLLRRLLAWRRGGGEETLVADGDGVRLELPGDLSRDLTAAVGPQLLHDVRLTGEVLLEDLEVIDGQVRVEARAEVRQNAPAPDSAVLRVRRRGTDESFDVEPEMQRTIRGPRGSVQVRVRFDALSVDHGVWDLYVVQRFGRREIVNRLGSKRSDRIEPIRHLLIDEQAAQRVVGTAYFTRGYGNVSLDVGFVLVARRAPDVTVIAVLRTHDGGNYALLRADPDTPLRITARRGPHRGMDGEELPILHLGSGLLAVTLVTVLGAPGRSLRITDPESSVIVPLPAARDLPAAHDVRITASTVLGGAVQSAERVAAGLLRRVRARGWGRVRPDRPSRP